jgi:hypothetical protein
MSFIVDTLFMHINLGILLVFLHHGISLYQLLITVL